jgi:hypothetical protein
MTVAGAQQRTKYAGGSGKYGSNRRRHCRFRGSVLLIALEAVRNASRDRLSVQRKFLQAPSPNKKPRA